MRNADGQGFAAFGRVVRGMDVVRKIQTGAEHRRAEADAADQDHRRHAAVVVGRVRHEPAYGPPTADTRRVVAGRCQSAASLTASASWRGAAGVLIYRGRSLLFPARRPARGAARRPRLDPACRGRRSSSFGRSRSGGRSTRRSVRSSRTSPRSISTGTALMDIVACDVLANRVVWLRQAPRGDVHGNGRSAARSARRRMPKPSTSIGTAISISSSPASA